jgi:glycosyltransferase involved in cell wall biosynthesis
MKLLLVCFYFPPAGGGGVQRPLKFAAHLPELGIETHVLAPDDPLWVHSDNELSLPRQAWVHRARYLGPRGRKPAEELHGLSGVRRYVRKLALLARRLAFPDENVSWCVTAIPAAIRLIRKHDIDVVLTTSPPGSVHFIGAAAKRATGVRWIADLRDPLIAHPHRNVERLLVRLKDQAQGLVARSVVQSADGIVTVSDAISGDVLSRKPRAPVVTIPNGSDFADYAGLEYVRGDVFRITHTGSFFGRRDPRPFLTALTRVEGVVARFVGDFRASDREWAESLALGDRLQLIPFLPHRSALELQRDSEALLLLIPDAGGRGRGILSGKVFEYLAAERPILALVPPDGAAARLLLETNAGVVVDPEDIDGIARELGAMRERWLSGSDTAGLSAEWRTGLSRRARVEDLAQFLRSRI